MNTRTYERVSTHHTTINLMWKGMIAAITTALMAILMAAPSHAVSNVVYDAIPDPLPPNVSSLGFQATSTSEFGDYVHLAGTSRTLDSVTVTMSDWAKYSDYSSDPRYQNDNVNWTHPVTLNVYSNHLDSNGVPDTLLSSKTSTISIPWRPATDPTCGEDKWRASDGTCYSGIAFNATFDMTNVTLPDDVIVGVAFNTESYGQNPVGQPGPYNSLNVGVPEGQVATTGSDDNVDEVFWNTSNAAFYTDGGAAGSGVFRKDTNWAPYGTVAFQVHAKKAMPTDKEQCKNNGWKSYGVYKNQGDCVSYVATKGKH